MKKFTASVVGGGVGGKLSIHALMKSEMFDLVAVADLRSDVCEDLRRQHPGLQMFRSHTEMMKAVPTDIVCVSTYPPSHEEVAMDALRLPLKGILVEKPLGHTADSGRRILEAIKVKGIPVAVPHGLIAKSTPLDVIRLVKRGEIGQLKLVEIQCSKWDIINAGIHWLNFFVLLTENVPLDYVMGICEGSTRTYRDGMQVETTAVTYAQTKSGIRVVMNTGDDVLVNCAGKDTLFRIIGTEGQLEFWGWEHGYRIVNEKYPKGGMIFPEELAVTGHQYHLERMADMILEGKIDYSVAESSLTALEICESAYISSKHQCKVTFPLDRFALPPASIWEMGVPYNGIGGGRDGRML